MIRITKDKMRKYRETLGFSRKKMAAFMGAKESAIESWEFVCHPARLPERFDTDPRTSFLTYDYRTRNLAFKMLERWAEKPRREKPMPELVFDVLAVIGKAIKTKRREVKDG